VKYARGRILRGSEDEATRQQHGLDLISQRMKKKGVGSLYNLLGVSRAQPLRKEDLSKLGFLPSLASIRGKAELSAVDFLGGDRSKHVGFVTNRVSASIVATMMTMVRPDEMVLCVSPDGRTHPSVKLGIRLAGGKFKECTGNDEFESSLDSEVSTVVVTTITPQLRHLPYDQVKKTITSAQSRGLHTFIDDAHGAIRMVAYREPPPMTLEPDATAISSDKHIFGPRAGVMAGQGKMIQKIRALSLQLGIEAPTPILAGVHRALKAHKTNHIERSLRVAKELEKRLEKRYPKWFYFANDCAGLTDENVVKILSQSSKIEAPLVPQEACSALGMLMLEKFGIITVSTTASPGAAPYLRLVTWPDGYRLPVEKIVDALSYAVDELAPVANDGDEVKRILFGN
jgi:L-seryl-tRNA(Ser) seleniumtransferase